MNRYQQMLRNLIMAQMVLHNADPAGQGGGGGGQDPAAAFQRLLEQNKNDGVAVASKLFDENFRYRGEIRDLKAKLPKEGSLVLTGDDAKEYEAFKALNVKAADAKKAIDAIPDLEKQNKELAGMEHLREIADLGLDGSKLKLSVLKDQLAKYPDAVLTFKTEKDADGKEAKVAYIKKTEKDSETKFADFAKADLADYLPSLKVSPEADQQQPFFTGNGDDPKPQGGPVTTFDQIRNEMKEKNAAAVPVRDINAAFNRPEAVAAG